LLTGKYDIIVFLVRDIKMDCYGRVYKLWYVRLRTV
jgi:hypothetical protein